jgi:hypothetical protein
MPCPSDDDQQALMLYPSPMGIIREKRIVHILKKSNLFTPGYIPPTVGTYCPSGFIYDKIKYNKETVIFPDRNILNRIINTYSGKDIDDSARIVAAMMAFAQWLDIQIDPEIPLYELASTQGNIISSTELDIFNAANNASIHKWANAALLGTKISMMGITKQDTYPDFTQPMRRWKRNYILSLKIGTLELSSLQPIDKVLNLFSWMYNDFIIAGPSAMLAIFYLSPRSPRRRCFKNLRSHNREKALDGIKNIALDITYLSNFSKHAHKSETTNTKYILATFDKIMKIAANLVVNNHTNSETPQALIPALEQWWSNRHAAIIISEYEKMLNTSKNTKRNIHNKQHPSFINNLIQEGEHAIRSWQLR